MPTKTSSGRRNWNTRPRSGPQQNMPERFLKIPQPEGEPARPHISPGKPLKPGPWPSRKRGGSGKA